MILLLRPLSLKGKLVHEPLDLLVIDLISAVQQLLMDPSDSVSSFMFFKNCLDLCDYLFIAVIIIIFLELKKVCRLRQFGYLKKIRQSVSFVSESSDDFCFFALTDDSACFCTIKALNFFRYAFSARKYSFSLSSNLSFS